MYTHTFDSLLSVSTTREDITLLSTVYILNTFNKALYILAAKIIHAERIREGIS